MTSRRTTSAILAILLIGCTGPTTVQQAKTLPSNSAKYEINPEPTAEPNQKTTGIPQPEGESPRTTIQQLESNKTSFDFSPVFDDRFISPGEVTVIFRDEFRVRKSESNTSISAINREAESAINNILSSNKVVEISDYSGGQDDKTTDAAEQKAEEYWKSDIPNRKSMLHIRFPLYSDTNSISKSIRELPYVLAAYRTPKITNSGLIKRWTYNATDISGPKPTDTEFSRSLENDTRSTYFPWYWFNRHKIFHAWGVAGSTPLPTVAVVDDGFDTRSNAFDKPSYNETYAAYIYNSGGYAHSVYGNLTAVQAPSGASSHGTFCASIIGSPKNNSGLCGVLPGTTIVPIRHDFSSIAISEAIQYSCSIPNCYTINCSLGVGNKPAIWDPTIKSAIAYATANGRTVVITAGNHYVDLDAPETNPFPTKPSDDSGCIIVGGLNMTGNVGGTSGLNWRNTSISPNNDGAGSNYGSYIHVSASANYISAATYSPSSPSAAGFLGLSQDGGTSYAAPMVTATAAMCRNLINSNGGTSTPGKIRNLIWGSSTIMKSHDGNLYGYLLGRSDINPGGNNGVRSLNMANAFYLAKMPTGQPVVRLMNINDKIWWTKNYDWNNKYSEELLSYDAIWDMRGEYFTSSDRLGFAVNNISDLHSHGYQIWRNGILVDEHLGGSAEYKLPWGGYVWTVGEDGGDTSAGWYNKYTLDFPALR